MGRFFSHFARRHRKRYLKKGLNASQTHLVTGLKEAGFEGSSILEIGCGVGYLHQSLLVAGAARSIGIDLSEGMVREARVLAKDRDLEKRTEYIRGDFVNLAGDLADADVTVLDKVVCCYPDAESLVRKSLDKTRRVYSLTYPRNRWFLRVGSAIGAFVLWFLGSQFRGYIHDPARIEGWINGRGFHKLYENRTAVWLTQIYRRDVAAGAGS